MKAFCHYMFLFAFICLPTTGRTGDKIDQPELIQDARQLAHNIESAHPDPYVNGGGKVAFHRRLQKLLSAIPANGLSRQEFFRLLLPFVAAIGDGHTTVRLGDEGSLMQHSPELPLVFSVVEKNLVVTGAYDKSGRRFLGARLESLGGVGIGELTKRQKRVRGTQTLNETMAILSLSLCNRGALEVLLPEWTNPARLKFKFLMPSHKTQSVVFLIPNKIDRQLWRPAPKIRLPESGKAELGYGFFKPDRKVAYLRIDGMMAYREALQALLAQGMSEAKAYTRVAYQQLHGKKPPDSIEKTLAGIPSATEMFRNLVGDMERAKTEVLIVDLRKNTGGSSIMKEILVYFLYGRSAMNSIDDGFQITKYSHLYFQVYANDNLSNVNRDKALPLMEADYDFSDQLRHRSVPRDDSFWKEFFKGAPDILSELKSRKFSKPGRRPAKVIVLCSTFTYSSGFNLLQDLYTQGAVLVGSPSAQSANNFGDSLPFKLNNSAIQAFVSHKANFGFPNDPGKGRMLMPHHVLTYEQLKKLKFDPNAEVQMALELVSAD